MVTTPKDEVSQFFYPSRKEARRKKTTDLGRLVLGGHLVRSNLDTPFRRSLSPLSAEGRAGADSMSHVPGLESWREAPPPPGPLLSPFFPWPLRVLPDAALQSPLPHHQFRWVRGPEEDAAPTGRWRGERLEGSHSGKAPAWVEAVLVLGRASTARAAREEERRGGGWRGPVRAAANPGATGCGAGGGPSPGISGDRVTAFAEWDGRPRRASRAVAPSSHRLRASAVPPLRAVTPCGGAAPRPQAALLW